MRHYQRVVVGFCVNILRGAVAHAEDLAQEVLLVAHCGWMAKSSRMASTCDDGPAREVIRGVALEHELRLYAVSSAFSGLQGHLVFQYNPDESQRLCWLGSQPAASRRNVRMARPPQQPNRGIAERRHDLGDIATAHLRAVFIERHIADPMRLVLNVPMPPHQLQQRPGVARSGGRLVTP